MWVQCDELPEGGVLAEPPEGVGDSPLGGGVVDDALGVSLVADVELPDGDVVEVEPLVAASATAAPPPTRTPAKATPASVCRSRILIPFTSFPTIGSACLP
jgi:hypothetical protein